jgi:hypothetical protein
MTAEDAQQPLGLRPEAAGLLGLEVQHADEAAGHDERDGGRALRARQAGKRDLAPGQCVAAALGRLADRCVHRPRAREIAHADDLAALGGDADQADADGHLGPGSRAA